MTPYKHQTEIAKQGYEIIKSHGLVYLAMLERTGKTLTAILIAEMSKANSILIITKKNAMNGWKDTLDKYEHISKQYELINYHSVHKISSTSKFDLVIVDESHSSGMATYPKKSILYKNVEKITKKLPIIFLSATPYAESKSQLYHQLGLTSYSPFNEYKNFYDWFKTYGIPKQIFVGGRFMNLYNDTIDFMHEIDHLFIKYTRKELGFEHEPNDVIHYIDLGLNTKKLYNQLLNDQITIIDGHELVCDSSMKLRTSLYMIEGGTVKINDDITLDICNREKINYIKSNFKENVAIMAHFVGEQEMLKKYFKNVYSSTSHAEGVDLSHIDELVVYSMDFSTARFIQRRARQANMKRDKPINVHFLLVKGAISEQVYNSVAVKKENFTNSCFERSTL